jgi:hypothetical protein
MANFDIDKGKIPIKRNHIPDVLTSNTIKQKHIAYENQTYHIVLYINPPFTILC